MLRKLSILILTTRSSWFLPYAKALRDELRRQGHRCRLSNDHRQVSSRHDIVFILSYFRLIAEDFLARHGHNVVVHESALPKGRGWAPLFWQILEGKNRIPMVLFEARPGVDSGEIYLRDEIALEGHELNAEIRARQAEKTLELCRRFVAGRDRLKPRPQRGRQTVYPRRLPADSQLDLNKTLRQQFNLLRIVDNERFPAFFKHRRHTYVLTIKKAPTEAA